MMKMKRLSDLRDVADPASTLVDHRSTASFGGVTSHFASQLCDWTLRIDSAPERRRRWSRAAPLNLNEAAARPVHYGFDPVTRSSERLRARDDRVYPVVTSALPGVDQHDADGGRWAQRVPVWHRVGVQ
jgi:hypothetical protein